MKRTKVNIQCLISPLTNRGDTYLDTFSGERVYHLDVKSADPERYLLLPKLDSKDRKKFKVIYINQLENNELKRYLSSKLEDDDFERVFHVETIDNDLDDDWHAFEKKLMGEVVKKWCAESDIPFYDESLPKKSKETREREIRELLEREILGFRDNRN